VEVARCDISPCIGCGRCETKGVCVHQDDMSAEIYTLLRQADAVVVATPIYFYNATAQLKKVIDRSQTLWSRRYRLKLTDPGAVIRRGAYLSMAATRGKGLFDGLDLTMQYFFDAISASGCERLTYRQIEHPDDLRRHPTVAEEVKRSVSALLAPFFKRKRVLFFGDANDCRSQMAAAFARHLGGFKLAVGSGGRTPANRVSAEMTATMAEAGVDMGFISPRSFTDALAGGSPDLVVDLTDGPPPSLPANTSVERWPLPVPDRNDAAGMQQLRDDIRQRVARMTECI